MKIFTEARSLFKHRGLLMLPVLLLLIYGCGPGFPIVTEEQQDLIDKVDTTSKKTQTLEQRLTTLESRGADKEGVEELKLRLAETTKAVEDMGREFSFIRGSIEESGNARAQTSSEITSLEESARGLNERLRALEAASTGNLEEVSKLKEELIASTKKIASLEDELKALKETIERPAETGVAGSTAITGGTPAQNAAPINEKIKGPVAKAARAKETPEAAIKKGDPEALYFQGFKLTKDKEFDKAAVVFKRFLSLYPRNRLADHARYWIGEIYYSRGNWERAILEFDRVIKEYPGGDKVPAAILKEGFSFERLGSKKEARLLLERLVEKYPNSPEAKMAGERIKKMKK